MGAGHLALAPPHSTHFNG